MIHPVTNRPADKRSFIPSLVEKEKVGAVTVQSSQSSRVRPVLTRSAPAGLPHGARHQDGLDPASPAAGAQPQLLRPLGAGGPRRGAGPTQDARARPQAGPARPRGVLQPASRVPAQRGGGGPRAGGRRGRAALGRELPAHPCVHSAWCGSSRSQGRGSSTSCHASSPACGPCRPMAASSRNASSAASTSICALGSAR